jgi:orotidine-5'-phosphate decarboxylase
MPKTFFLIPGYGAQGGKAGDAACCFDKDGLGGIVNSSRGIIAAWKKAEYAGADYRDAAREEALKMKADLGRFIHVR